jgi:hypothetical protein
MKLNDKHRSEFMVRFDDICSTMRWDIWERIEALLIEKGVKPILSVIPDVQDEKLRLSRPNDLFWDRVRQWQRMGWTIGLHGYQHVYVNDNAGILRLNSQSEFAGLSYEVQLQKLKSGLAIFQREGVHPDVWVAPAHSFDLVTLRALADCNMRIVSDGPWRWPGWDARGMFWVPQQLWRFRESGRGLWTVCLHHNYWGDAAVDRMLGDLRHYADRCVTVKEVLRVYGNRRLDLTDYFRASAEKWRRRIGRVVVPLLGGNEGA